jgi:hypothetical protein
VTVLRLVEEVAKILITSFKIIRSSLGFSLSLSLSLSLCICVGVSEKLGFVMEAAEMNIGYWVTRALLCKKLLFEATTRTNRP